MGACCLKISQQYGEKGERKKFLKKDGASQLKELIASSKRKHNRSIQIFSAKELKTATNNYSYPLSFIRNDGYYKLYKGYLKDRSISVMKFTKNVLEAYQQCCNNIVYAFHMNHMNVINLIGCCLQTRIPILVFEAVGYGTLADRIHYRRQPFFDRLLWTKRLNIAVEIANAMSYLHDGFPRPVISRSITLQNILFDEQGLVKLFDFTLAAFIPEDEAYVNDGVRATMRYIAPEYAMTGDFNEKCDVYNFGVILLQLLIGQEKMESSDYERIILREGLEKCLGNNKFIEIVDPIILEDGLCLTKKQQLKDFIALALKCTSESPEDRPPINDVAQQIRKMYQSCI
ncbi:hypothetical protein Dsin_023528 [Dipteronia sinensis]|uniref:Protein kinase domain-containing protein n=1 Tax=Dipteronia sinensis TaxID=43782 RepID=A0AAE0A3G6_9ROSI|nr:hypothetical protein Dsin_023528 [Dipteronia sinensis]